MDFTYFKLKGKQGGQKKSARKRKAVLENLKKANARRRVLKRVRELEWALSENRKQFNLIDGKGGPISLLYAQKLNEQFDKLIDERSRLLK